MKRNPMPNIWALLIAVCLMAIAACSSAASSAPAAILTIDARNQLHVLMKTSELKITPEVTVVTYANLNAQRSLTVTYQDTPVAPQSWSGSIYYDIASRELSAIVATKLSDLKIHGRPTGFELDGFTGAVFMRDGKNTTGNSKAVLGAGIVYRRELFDNVSAFAGLGVSIAGGRPAGAGVMAGFGIKF